MDEIAAKLRQQGISASVHNHLAWASIADDAAAEYKSGRVKTIVLVGHSSGATCLPDIVARLDRQGVPVKLAIGLDSVFHTSLAGRVGRYINFYVANGAGTRVEKTKTSVERSRMSTSRRCGVSPPYYRQERAHAAEGNRAIDAVVLGGGSEPRAAKKPQPVSDAVPPGSSAKRAAN